MIAAVSASTRFNDSCISHFSSPRDSRARKVRRSAEPGLAIYEDGSIRLRNALGYRSAALTRPRGDTIVFPPADLAPSPWQSRVIREAEEPLMENARTRMLRLCGSSDKFMSDEPERPLVDVDVLSLIISAKICFSHARRTRSPGWESELYRERVGTSAERARGGYVRQGACFLTRAAPFQWTFCGSARDRSHGTIKVLHRRAARERNVRRAQSCSRDFSSLVAKLSPIATRDRDLGAHERVDVEQLGISEG